MPMKMCGPRRLPMKRDRRPLERQQEEQHRRGAAGEAGVAGDAVVARLRLALGSDRVGEGLGGASPAMLASTLTAR